jgi:hypothetical protein
MDGERNILKRLLLLAFLVWPSTACATAYSGDCSIWASRHPTSQTEYSAKFFAGTQAGFDAAKIWVGTNGIITINPGCEGEITTGALSDSVQVLWHDSGGVKRLGPRQTLSIGRLGPPSSGTTGGAIRIVDGIAFALTVAGVQAAIDECSAAGGGTVMVPANANILLATTPIILKDKVALEGFGEKTHDNGSMFISNASTNLSFAIVAGDTTGTQHLFQLDGVTIDGNKSAGARIDAGIYSKHNFVGSRIDNCRVANVSGRGIVLTSAATGAAGSFLIRNTIVNDTGDYNILVKDAFRNLTLDHVEMDRPGRNTAALALLGESSDAGILGVNLRSLYFEIQDSMSVAVLIDMASSVDIDGLLAVHPAGRFRAAVQVKNTGPGTFGFSPSGLTIRNLYANSDTLIENQYTGEVITTGADVNNPYRHVAWYTSAISKGSTSTNGYRNSAMVIGVDQAKKGPDITSASTIAPHPDGSDFDVTGTTTVTSITGLPYFLWKTTCFWTASALQFTDGGDLNLNGDFIGDGAGGKDCLCLKWDGTNWNEVSRNLAPAAGGGGSSNQFDNNTWLYWKDSGGTYRPTIKVDSVNTLRFQTLPSNKNIDFYRSDGVLGARFAGVDGTWNVTGGGNYQMSGFPVLYYSGNDMRIGRNTSTGNVAFRDSANTADLVTIDNSGNTTVKGTLTQFQPANVTSNTSITLGTGNVFKVTGVTTVDTITIKATGTVVYIYVPSACTFTDGGGNMQLNGNFVGDGAGGDDMLILESDGTNWNEVGRSLN